MSDVAASPAEQAACPPVGVERRASVRIAVRIPAAVSMGAKPDGQRHAATIKDISDTGVGLFAECRFPVETVLYIRGTESTEPPFVAEVVHNRADGDGWFHGCKILWKGDPRNHS